MKINGYEINFTEQELDNMLNTQSRVIEFIAPDFEGYQNLSEIDKKVLSHLYKVAKIINDIALEQDHPLNRSMKTALERTSLESVYVQKALELFNSLNGVAGFNGIDKDPIMIFKNISLLKGKNFYPEDLSIEEFHQILIKMARLGKIDEIRKILSARTMVRRKEDELIAIDYTEYFAKEFYQIAKELETASTLCKDENFKQYLHWQAQALLFNDEKLDMIADKYWASLQDTTLEFTISRENYEDEMTSSVYQNQDVADLISKHNIDVVAKDTLGCRVGIVNKRGTEFILSSKKTLPHLMKWMPYNDKYIQVNLGEDIKQAMVDVDIVTLTGEYAMCRGGITSAQNLPNNDKLAVKTGGGRRNVYHKQVLLSKDDKREKQLLDRLVSSTLHQYVDKSKIMDFVIYHENGHSLGPNDKYQNAMGLYRHIVEEHKADVISIACMSEVAKAYNLYTDLDLKKIYTTWVVNSLLLKAEPVFAHPHRMAELIQFNYLVEHKVIWFDADKKLNINFNEISQIMYKLLAETIELQLSESVSKAADFVKRWTYWSEISEYIAKTQKQLGLKPYIKIVTKF